MSKHRVKPSVGSVLSNLGWLAALTLLVVVAFSGIFGATVVNGKSMLPTYTSGDLLISIKTNDYKIGDVVVYHPDDLECTRCNIVHRIVKIVDGKYQTLGDNNENTDPWMITNPEIHGKVFVALPTAAIMPILSSTWMWVGIASLAGLGYLYYRYREFSKDDENEEDGVEEPERVKGLHRATS